MSFEKQIPLEQLQSQATEVASLLKIMGHPERLLLLCLLSQDSLNVSELVDNLGMGQSQISQSLQKLEQLGIVSHKRQGKQKFYEIADERVKKLIRQLYEIFCK